ncbi:hypothetical protein ELS18_02265 [Clostridium perfringens]|uniref:hypothetical protein n=1 Tax=Clostridium perfringens TaxID=1502 RepID=UPI000F8D9BAA|nr:hypothetical protein [Clostridium perfringens]RUR41861.1 hypothetical protein ELS18_02265 [Clostridium perfringens]
MANKKVIIKPKVITTAMQLAKILKEYKNVKNHKLEKGSLTLTIEIRPTKLSRSYDVNIKYKLGKKPIISIINIDSLKDIKLPHTYKNNELCLYYPKNREWTKYDYISDTIIPWISEWLYFYEVWTITNEWYGGGIHP